jgi:hypothetical protein
MKIKLILGVITIALLSLTSCKKDYNCVCKAGVFSVDAETYQQVTKNDAEERCTDYEAEAKETFGSGVTCSINEAE